MFIFSQLPKTAVKFGVRVSITHITIDPRSSQIRSPLPTSIQRPNAKLDARNIKQLETCQLRFERFLSGSYKGTSLGDEEFARICRIPMNQLVNAWAMSAPFLIADAKNRTVGGTQAKVMKTVNEETVNEELKNEVLATYAAYLRAFNANDIHAIDNLIQYPLAHIDNGRTNLVDTYPFKPAELMAKKQWHATNDPNCEVVFASTEKAHVILRSANRVRADGSLIEITAPA